MFISKRNTSQIGGKIFNYRVDIPQPLPVWVQTGIQPLDLHFLHLTRENKKLQSNLFCQCHSSVSHQGKGENYRMAHINKIFTS